MPARGNILSPSCWSQVGPMWGQFGGVDLVSIHEVHYIYHTYLQQLYIVFVDLSKCINGFLRATLTRTIGFALLSWRQSRRSGILFLSLPP